jgi:hypothetical protein
MPVSVEEPPSVRGYEESTDYEWTRIAFAKLEGGNLHGEVIASRGIVRSRVWGECPACEHELDDRQTHTAVTSAFGGEWRGTARGDDDTGKAAPAYYEVDVSCGCGHAHPGAPADRTGCGASFRVELLVRADVSDGKA